MEGEDFAGRSVLGTRMQRDLSSETGSNSKKDPLDCTTSRSRVPVALIMPLLLDS